MPDSGVWKRLTDFADSQAPGLARSLRQAIRSLQASANVSHIEELLRRGDIEGAAALAFDPVSVRSAFEPVKRSLAQTLVASGDYELRTVMAMRGRLAVGAIAAQAARPTRGLIVRLDAIAPGVLDALGAYERGPLLEITRSLQDGFAHAIRTNVEAGAGPAELARKVRPLIGLTERQAAASARLRAELEAGQVGAAMRRALRDKRYDRTLVKLLGPKGKPLTAKQINDMVAAYEAGLIRHGTTMWARDTSIRLLQDGHRLAWEQTFADTDMDRANVLKRWVVSPDERVCEICAPIPEMNPPKGIPFDAMFATPIGPLWGPLGHYACRCVNWIRPAVRRVI